MPGFRALPGKAIKKGVFVSPGRITPRMRPAKERICDFKEVSLGYTEEEAVAEASRCLLCGACVKGCPVGIDIPGFIKAIQEKDFKRGYQIIKKHNLLPAICGRVCPQEAQCEAVCILGKKGDPINIGALERFLADHHADESIPRINENGHKAAIVGSGPGGLTAAFELRRAGFQVTVYEALHELGGVLKYGIPGFRLPDDVVDREIETLKKMGVEFLTSFLIGKTLTIDELLQNNDAVLIATGAGLPGYLGIPGENGIGVLLANELLTRVNLMKAYDFPRYDTPVISGKKIVVIGGGNVAMDTARVSRRMGADVVICYRREEKDMPARLEERLHAKEEGIDFQVLTNPVEILLNDEGRVRGMTLERMKITGVADDGRSRIASTKETFEIETDVVVEAIGQSPNKIIRENVEGLEFDKKGRIVVDENLKTTKDNVWAAGDIVSGAATVILAMGEAKEAARAIVEKFGG
jgi:glutamate synthase (NADPH/NADH) small chain